MIFITDMRIGQYMEKKLYERFFEIYEDVLKECKYPPKFNRIPIQVSINICSIILLLNFSLTRSIIME